MKKFLLAGAVAVIGAILLVRNRKSQSNDA